MEIIEKIQNKIKEFQKSGENISVDTLRLLLSEIHNYEIKKRGLDNKNLSEDDVIQIIQKEIKKRKESLEFFKKAQRNDLIAKTKKEIETLSLYAPQILNEEELSKIIEDLINQGFNDFNSLMKKIMENYKGKIDGSMAAKLIKQKLG